MLSLLLSLALAQEAPEEDSAVSEDEPLPEIDEGAPVMEVLVLSERNEAEARKELDMAIREEGYLPGIPVGKRTFYMPWKIWKPKVTVHQEGMVRVKARAVVPMFVLPTWPPMVVGVWDSPRKARGMESRLLIELDPKIDAWREAKSHTGQVLRREQLRQTVEELVASELSRAEQRMVWIALWRNTADNAAGEAVRVYLEELAEQAAWRFSEEELRFANTERGFPRPLDPEALGADFVPEPVLWTEEAMPRPQAACPEPVELDLEPSGLSSAILNTPPLVDHSPQWLDNPIGEAAENVDRWATDNGLFVERPQDIEDSGDPCR